MFLQLVQSMSRSPTPDSPLVYLVNCDTATRSELEAELAKHHISVSTYENAESLLQSDVNASATCMVISEQLPGLSGIELLETLNRKGLRIPTILISNANSVKSAVRAMQAKAVDYLEGPVSTRVLVTKILNL